MQSNHPCKEIVHFYSLPDFFYSSLSLSLSFLLQLINDRSPRSERKKKNHRDNCFTVYLSSPPSLARDPTRYLVSLFLVDSVQLNPSANSSHEWHRYSTCIGFSQLRSAVAKRCSWPRAHCHARIGLVRYSLVTDFSFPRFLNKKRRREIDLEGNRSIFSKRNDENERKIWICII